MRGGTHHGVEQAADQDGTLQQVLRWTLPLLLGRAGERAEKPNQRSDESLQDWVEELGLLLVFVQLRVRGEDKESQSLDRGSGDYLGMRYQEDKTI